MVFGLPDGIHRLMRRVLANLSSMWRSHRVLQSAKLWKSGSSGMHCPASHPQSTQSLRQKDLSEKPEIKTGWQALEH